MRLRPKLALLISGCLLLSLCLVTYSQARFFAVDQESYLSDLQSTLAISIEKRLDLSMTLLYTQLQEVLSGENFDFKTVVLGMPGVQGGELWKDGKPWKAYPAFSGVAFPHPREGSWTLWQCPSGEHAKSLRWIATFDRITVALGIDPQWVAASLDSSHGTTTELVSSEGDVLLRADQNSREAPLGVKFTSRTTLNQMLKAQPGIVTTSRFLTDAKVPFLGTFLPLSTDPPLIIVVRTPASSIDAVLKSTFRKSSWIGLFSLLLTLAIGAAFSQTLTSPLSNLVRQTFELAQGRFNLPALKEVERKDEVGMLARAFMKMGRELEKLQASLRKTERTATLGKFSASIAHEIRNPLASIILNCQVACRVAKKPDPANLATLDEVLTLALEEAMRANRIIDRLMKYSRQEKAPTQTVDLVERTLRSMTLLTPLAEKAGVELTSSLCDGPVRALADADQIHEVLANLVQNAFHAVETSPIKRVSVSLSHNGSQAELTVTDTGKGITAEAREHLFEPFFTTKTIGKGTGLGLAVCQGIVQSHKGRIEVESPSEGGARFRVVLPLAVENVRAAA